MLCVCWLVCSTLDEDIPVIDEVDSDVICPSVVADVGTEDEGVPVVDNIGSSVEPISMVDVWNEVMLMDSGSVVEVNSVVCVCSLVCSILDEDIFIVDEVNSDVFASVKGDGDVEDEGVLVVNNVDSAVEPFSSVDDSNVVVLIAVTTVVNVDCDFIVDSDSVVDGN